MAPGAVVPHSAPPTPTPQPLPETSCPWWGRAGLGFPWGAARARSECGCLASRPRAGRGLVCSGVCSLPGGLVTGSPSWSLLLLPVGDGPRAEGEEAEPELLRSSPRGEGGRQIQQARGRLSGTREGKAFPGGYAAGHRLPRGRLSEPT